MRMYRLSALSFVLILMFAGCGESHSDRHGGNDHGNHDHDHNDHNDHMNMSPEVQILPPYGGDWTPARFDDVNPEANVIEVYLEAMEAEVEYLPGKTATMWTYNGSTPGPLLEANVGDEVIIHFTNNLPEPTTVHWHGIRLPAEMDGTHAVQNPVQPGESFTYEFTLLDAGLFWYHPHLRSDEQVARGLYGAILVRDDSEVELPVASEHVAVLHDMHIDEEGNVVVADDMMSLMNGRQGNLVFVNGHVRPTLQMRAGERHLLRVVNASSARYYRLALPEHGMELVGVDAGRLEAAVAIDEILLAPGERADLILTATAEPGDMLDLMSLPYERGHGTGQAPEFPVLHVMYSAEEAVATEPLPQELRQLPILPEPSSTVEFVLTEEMDHDEHAGHAGHVMEPEFFINGEAYPNITPLEARLGDTQIWEVFNDSEMDHPFHLHGFFFEVLTRDGVAEPYRAFKDTVNVAAHETVELLVHFDGFPGHWMFHCHILEHEERGMMGKLIVSE